jgi:hypothetical protein
MFRVSANISDALDRDLTVTGVNVGERPETRDLGIGLKKAVFSTAVNNHGSIETDSNGSVSLGSTPSPPAPKIYQYAGKTPRREEKA